MPILHWKHVKTVKKMKSQREKFLQHLERWFPGSWDRQVVICSVPTNDSSLSPCRAGEFLRWSRRWVAFQRRELRGWLSLRTVVEHKWQWLQHRWLNEHQKPLNTKIRDIFQETFNIFLTELNTGKSKWVFPPLPGLTPPTIRVPYSMACCEWKVPCFPVNPWQITFVSFVSLRFTRVAS